MPNRAISLPEGYRSIFFDTLDSTNAEALRQASSGERSGLWIWSGDQQAGRGRSGRTWESLPGNLFCSLLLKPTCRMAVAPQLGFVAGIALHNTISGLQSRDTTSVCQLKWPNDLLLNGKKAGGILLESRLQADGCSTVVIGIGLNVTTYPREATYPATSLAQEVIDTTSENALRRLAHHCDTWIKTWNNGAGFSLIRDEWLDRSLAIGSPMTLKLPGKTLEGGFGGLDQDGALILTMKDGGKKHVTAGDVFPL